MLFVFMFPRARNQWKSVSRGLYRFNHRCVTAHLLPPVMPLWVREIELLSPQVNVGARSGGCKLSLLSLNMGGASAAVEHVISMVVMLEPDVVCLQGLWDLDFQE